MPQKHCGSPFPEGCTILPVIPFGFDGVETVPLKLQFHFSEQDKVMRGRGEAVLGMEGCVMTTQKLHHPEGSVSGHVVVMQQPVVSA